MGVLFFLLYGILSIVSQLLLLQELVIVFSGHELFLGFSLAAWMGWVGFGSWLARRPKWNKLPLTLAGLIPLLLFNLILIRLSKLLFGFGMLIGLLPTLILTTFLLAPIGIAIGLTFTLGCRWSHDRFHFSMGRAYFYETLGAALGGIFYSWLVAGHLSPEWTLFLISITAALLLILVLPPRQKWPSAILVILTLSFALSPIPLWSRALQWRGYSLLQEHHSRYGHYLLAKTGTLTIFFENGVISSHFPDPSAYEELVHWPLLAHPSPGRVLIIGGAASGSLSEILKHPVTQVDFIELDPSVIRLIKPSLSSADQAALEDPRIRVIHQDGRRWLKNSRERYDVILLQLPQPLNAQINRLYTLEAFQKIRDHLNPGGLFSFTLPSSENYLSDEVAYFNGSLYRTLNAAFPSVELVAGNPLILVASTQHFQLDVDTLAQRYLQRALSNKIVIPGYLPIKLDERRRSQLLSQLTSIRRPLLNRDFAPVSYSYSWRVWFSKFVSPFYFLGMILSVVLLAILLKTVWTRRRTFAQRSGPTALFLLGFAGILYETVLILAFQSLDGCLYWQLGTLFASFMLGLAIGSGAAVTQLSKINESKANRWLRILLILTGIEGLLLMGLLPIFQRLSPALPWMIPFASLLAITGVWLGFAFPIASCLSPSDIPRAAGTLYAADLWGAALGALLTSAFLVPIFGLVSITGAMGLVLIISTLPEFLSHHKDSIPPALTDTE